MCKQRVIFYVSHGINTDKYEYAELMDLFMITSEKVLGKGKGKGKGIYYSIFDGSYGYLSTFLCWIPWIRKLLIRSVNKDLKNIRTIYGKDAIIVLVSYSYSTYLISKVLEENNHDIHTWCLYGGVVHCRFNFDQLRSKIGHVVNYCSTEDEVTKYAPKFLGFGHCGTYGFRYPLGKKAIVNKESEIVWRCDDLDTAEVENRHYNSVEHSGKGSWFSSDKYIKHFLEKLNFDKRSVQ